jgi:hypothetical protein
LNYRGSGFQPLELRISGKMPLPLYGERELWVIPIMTSYSTHEGAVVLVLEFV